jgi:hypothetical protein
VRPEVCISFRAEEIPGGPQAVLDAAGIDADAAEVHDFTVQRVRNISVRVTLAESDERRARLFEVLRQYGEDWSESHFDRYTDEELDNARLLFMKSKYGECEVDGGIRFGTTYDLSTGCPGCGSGARQTSALFLDGDDDELPKLQGHRAGVSYDNHVFVDERIAAELDELGPTGLVFHNVYALMPDKRQVKLRWKQISADRTLPRMLPQTDGFSQHEPCGLCGRSGYLEGARLRIFYRASDLEGAGDVNLTWEGHAGGCLTGEPWDIGLPVPWLLVTPKVMRVFRAAGVTEFDWVPIQVVDE